MKRCAINAWYDPEIDADLADWDATCPNKSDYVRRAIKEKLRRWKYAETREQDTLDAILVAQAEIRDVLKKLLERMGE